SSPGSAPGREVGATGTSTRASSSVERKELVLPSRTAAMRRCSTSLAGSKSADSTSRPALGRDSTACAVAVTDAPFEDVAVPATAAIAAEPRYDPLAAGGADTPTGFAGVTSPPGIVAWPGTAAVARADTPTGSSRTPEVAPRFGRRASPRASWATNHAGKYPSIGNPGLT